MNDGVTLCARGVRTKASVAKMLNAKAQFSMNTNSQTENLFKHVRPLHKVPFWHRAMLAVESVTQTPPIYLIIETKEQ